MIIIHSASETRKGFERLDRIFPVLLAGLEKLLPCGVNILEPSDVEPITPNIYKSRLHIYRKAMGSKENNYSNDLPIFPMDSLAVPHSSFLFPQGNP